MRISARVQNSEGRHDVILRTGAAERRLAIAPRESGFGSSVNGGELLFLALATCFCNDVYREAAGRGVQVEAIEVEVEGDFGAAGEPARNIGYRVKVRAQGSESAIRELIAHTDEVAEIQSTLRAGAQVKLAGVEVIAR